LIFQIFSATASPVYPESPRMYFTETEVEAKNYAVEYQNRNQKIYTDPYFSFINTPREESPSIHSLHPELLEGNLPSDKSFSVVYRSEYPIIRTADGWWRLTWDPKGRLENKCNLGYQSGDSSVYYCQASERAS
jgi:hypothetical protein